MRGVIRGGLFLLGLVATVLCLSVHIDSQQNNAAQSLSVTLGAIGPWLKYTKVPGHTSLHVNLITWSSFSGAVALACLWCYQALPPAGKPPKEPT